MLDLIFKGWRWSNFRETFSSWRQLLGTFLFATSTFGNLFICDVNFREPLSSWRQLSGTFFFVTSTFGNHFICDVNFREPFSSWPQLLGTILFATSTFGNLFLRDLNFREYWRGKNGGKKYSPRSRNDDSVIISNRVTFSQLAENSNSSKDHLRIRFQSEIL